MIWLSFPARTVIFRDHGTSSFAGAGCTTTGGAAATSDASSSPKLLTATMIIVTKAMESSMAPTIIAIVSGDHLALLAAVGAGAPVAGALVVGLEGVVLGLGPVFRGVLVDGVFVIVFTLKKEV